MSLSALLEAKKRKLAQAKNDDAQPQSKKYKTRGEIEEEKRKAQKAASPETTVPSVEPKKEESPEIVEEQGTPTIPLDEVLRRLRARREPITLFGETDWQRERRLLFLEERDAGESEYKSGSADQFGLDLKEMDDESMNVEVKVGKGDEGEEGEDLALPVVPEVDPDTLCREDQILFLFQKLLREWETELNERSDTVKRTANGKVATATFKQTVRNIRPLFKLLRKRSMARDILNPLWEIVKSMKVREYVAANKSYLTLAIGNAPWPMGVTMVGIHERSAREKIFSNQVAHILNDETQRKYIQAVKRLMSYAQAKYPNNPSKNIG